MAKQFYSHLIEIDTVMVELDQMDLTAHEKLHLAKLADSTLHHTILNAVLDQLSEEDRQLFLRHLLRDDHDEIWQLLNQKVDKVEDRIKEVATQVKKELHQDIKEAKEKRLKKG